MYNLILITYHRECIFIHNKLRKISSQKNVLLINKITPINGSKASVKEEIYSQPGTSLITYVKLQTPNN